MDNNKKEEPDKDYIEKAVKDAIDKILVKETYDYEDKLDKVIRETNSLKKAMENYFKNEPKEAVSITKQYFTKYNYQIENNLKYLISQTPYTQTEIAEMLGISPKTLSNMVANRFNTSLEIGLKLSLLFGVSVNEIFKLVKQEK
jgi:putative transcriptional regulator